MPTSRVARVARVARSLHRLGAWLVTSCVLATVLGGCSLPAHTPPKAPKDGTVGTQAAGYGLPVGSPVPDVTVTNLAGKRVSLRAAIAQEPTVLVFYRGGFCPYCNFQLHELTTRAAAFRERGVTLAAISVDQPRYGAKTAEENAAAFVLFSDADRQALQTFHVVNHLDGVTAFALARLGEDPEKRSGRSHHDVAVPSIFLIDRAGIIRWVHLDPDYRRRPSVDAILAAIDASGIATTALPTAPATTAVDGR
jgi:peroxiredoxin